MIPRKVRSLHYILILGPDLEDLCLGLCLGENLGDLSGRQLVCHWAHLTHEALHCLLCLLQATSKVVQLFILCGPLCKLFLSDLYVILCKKLMMWVGKVCINYRPIYSWKWCLQGNLDPWECPMFGLLRTTQNPLMNEVQSIWGYHPYWFFTHLIHTINHSYVISFTSSCKDALT